MIQVDREPAEHGFPARLFLGARAQFDLIEVPVLHGAEGDPFGTQHPGGRQFQFQGPGFTHAFFPVHAQAPAAQADAGPLQADVAFGLQLAGGDLVVDVVGQQEQIGTLHRPVLQGPALGALLDRLAAQPQRHGADLVRVQRHGPQGQPFAQAGQLGFALHRRQARKRRHPLGGQTQGQDSHAQGKAGQRRAWADGARALAHGRWVRLGGDGGPGTW